MSDNILAMNGRAPSTAGAWVASTATVIGSATVGRGTGAVYSAVVRADVEDIVIGANSNVQDTAVIHADPGHPARIGDDVSVGHGVVLQGCTVDGRSPYWYERDSP